MAATSGGTVGAWSNTWAVSFETCVRQAESRLWLGLTATPYRRDGLEAIIALQCGPPHYEITAKEVAEAALVHRELVVHETLSQAPGEDAPIPTVFAALVDDQPRTDQVCAEHPRRPPRGVSVAVILSSVSLVVGWPGETLHVVTGFVLVPLAIWHAAIHRRWIQRVLQRGVAR